MRKSDRGFCQGDWIVGPYKSKVRVYESSGDNPCVWLRVKEPADLNKAALTPIDEIEDWEETTVLLTVKQALDLAEQLTYLVRTHFNVDWGIYDE